MSFRRLWPVLVAALPFVQPLAGQPADWQAGIARITARKDLARASGTAFTVATRNGNAYLVTSAHVVEGDPNPQVEFVAEPEKVYRVSVRAIEPEERGLALLVVSNAPPGVRAIPESSQPVTLGASVTIAGFPASLNRFSLLDTTIATVGGRDLFLSRETDEGFSGGPVLVGGSVVGIVYGREGGFGKALGASSIKPFIEGNSLTWATGGSSSQPPVSTQAVASKEPAPGETRVNQKDGLTYVWIPPGKLTMGCSAGDSECFDDEKPPHEVTITRGFWMGQTPVPQEAYQRIGSNPSSFKGPRLPVETGTWDEAKSYCEAVGMRLPTEAEWEYAARGGSTAPRYGALDAVAWHGGNSGRKTHEAGQKQPNAFKLYDMLGNVSQWVADWYDEKYYERSPATDPPGPGSGRLRVLRGGSWLSVPGGIRTSVRDRGGPSDQQSNIGFRCAGELR